MDFRQLEAYVATVDHQSFSVAAEKLYLSQPTISSYINALERELNTKLIRRTTKKFEVTREGQQLYEYATSLLNLQKKAISELSNNAMRDLRIGTSSVPGQCILPSMLAKFRAEFSNVICQVIHGDSASIIEQVETGTLDVGLVGRKTDSDCLFVPIASDELVIAAPNTAYFREKYGKDANISCLMKEPIIMRTEQSGTQWEAEQLLQRLNLTDADLNIAARVNDAHALQNYVLQGLGVAMVSRRMVEEDEQAGKLLVYSLGKFARPRKFYLVYQASPYLPKSAAAFIQLVKRNLDTEE